MDAYDIVRLSKTAAIATDAEDRVLTWNDAAREFSCLDDSKVIGRRLADVFQPKDIFGNPLRYEGALFFSLLQDGESVRNFECSLRKSTGEYQRVAVSVVMLLGQGATDNQLVHVLRVVRHRRRADAFLARVLNGSESTDLAGLGSGLRASAAADTVLTPRQKEVLRALAEGAATGEIAEQLCISAETVRSHVGHILDRLDAHSRVEAVAAAYRRHLI